MDNVAKIISASPRYSIPGGDLVVDCEGFQVGDRGKYACFVGGIEAKIVAASPKRVIAVIPEGVETELTHVHLENDGRQSDPYEIVVGKRLVDGMHIVANPAVDPKDDTIVITRSGSRGQELPFTLYRLEPDGYLDELPAQVRNPTAIAFDPSGDLFVTNRADGEVVRVDRSEDVSIHADGLGIATALAFSEDGTMYVGDRTGTIFRIPGPGRIETFAVLEPTVAAYHMAFGPDGRLFVSTPGFGSFDHIYAIDQNGSVEVYFRRFGRPQGLAFDTDGNLYVAACYRGRRGIYRVAPGGSSVRHFVSGNSIVGLCFTRKGDLIVATGDSIYSIPAGVYGALVDR